MEAERHIPDYELEEYDDFDLMFGDLHNFANRISGNTWENETAHRTAFERSLSADFDSDNALKSDLFAPTLGESSQAEDITIRFVAEQDEYDNGYFYTEYSITYMYTVPVELAEIPTQYQEQLLKELESFNEENDTEFSFDDQKYISEIHVHEYYVYEEDDSITYREGIAYEWIDGVEVEGEIFESKNERQVVHGQDIDDHGFELGQYRDQVESADLDPEAILYDDVFAQMTDENGDIKTLFHSENDHARRVTTLLNLLKSGIFD